MDSILFSVFVVSLCGLLCYLLYHAAVEEDQGGFVEESANLRSAVFEGWWRELLAPESRMALTAAAICVLILSLK
jgi:hypothetical protein